MNNKKMLSFFVLCSWGFQQISPFGWAIDPVLLNQQTQTVVSEIDADAAGTEVETSSEAQAQALANSENFLQDTAPLSAASAPIYSTSKVEYDGEGKVSRRLMTYYTNSSKTKVSSTDDFRYSAGILTLRYRQFYGASVTDPVRVILDNYYPDGKTLKNQEDTRYSGKLRTYRYYTEYDSAGIKLRYAALTYQPDGKSTKILDDTRYQNGIEKTRYYTVLDSNGNKTRYFTGTYDMQGDLEASDDIRYSAGLVVSRTRQYYQGGGTDPVRVLSDIFYADGKTLKTQEDIRYEGKLKTLRYYTEYNALGIKTRYVIFSYQADGKSTKTMDDYRYQSGNLLNRYYQVLDSAGVKTRYFTQTYDASGKIESARDIFYAKGKATKSIFFDYDAEEKISRRLERTYQADGVTVKASSDGYYEQGLQTRRSYYEYSLDSKATRFLSETYQAGSLYESFDNFYTSGILTSRIHSLMDPLAQLPAVKKHYACDLNGKRCEEQYRYTYAYDSQKRILSSVKSWSETPLESSDYEYDDGAGLVKVRDMHGNIKIYDSSNRLVGAIQDYKEYVISSYQENGQTFTRWELKGAQALQPEAHVYDSAGKPVSSKLANGALLSYQTGKLASVKNSAGQLLLLYTYDLSGNFSKVELAPEALLAPNQEMVRLQIDTAVLEFYMAVLGRQPNAAELSKAFGSVTTAKNLMAVDFKKALGTEHLIEIQTRKQWISQVKQRVLAYLQAYQQKTRAEQVKAAHDRFMLTEDQLVFPTAKEIQKITAWINQLSLQFGQPGYLAFEKLLSQEGILMDRKDMVEQLILLDVLTGKVTPFQKGGLTISPFAFKWISGMTQDAPFRDQKSDFDRLADFYQNFPGQKVMTQISRKDVLLDQMTKTRNAAGEIQWTIAYQDLGSGPESQPQIHSVSREEFIKLWSGVVLGPEMDSRGTLVHSELEEMAGWNALGRTFEEGSPLGAISLERMKSDPDVTRSEGDFSSQFTGSRTTQEVYYVNLPVKPNTKYKISAWIKVEDRATYNMLDLNYSSSWQQLLRPQKGVWSGEYHLMAGGNALAKTVDLLPLQDHDEIYVANSDLDWFYETSTIETAANATTLTLSLHLKGFDGKVYIDGLRLEEVESHIDEKYFHVPVQKSFKGMEILGVAKQPLEVKTSAGRFNFSDRSISLEKGGEKVSELVFEEGFLKGLKAEREPGLVILENENILISIGADSSVTTKLKKPAAVHVAGTKKPDYQNFEAGVLVAANQGKGVFFSPLLPQSTIAGMPYQYDPNRLDFTYPDTALEQQGIKNWQMLRDFSGETWEVRYDFKKGDGFTASLFPPKEFDEKAYYTERVGLSNLNLNTASMDDFSYYIQKFKERFNVLLLWMNAYAASENDQNPPSQYYIDSNGRPVSPTTPGARAVSFSPVDSAGPYIINDELNARLKKLVDEAHRQGVKVIGYMSPRVYHTSDPDALVENMMENIKKANLDGIYFDGLPDHRPLQTLELLRKTRNALGDKLLIQHSSWVTSFLHQSDHFRVPVFDAYADQLWTGESVRKVDDNAWRYNYAGRMSNTPSALLGELRPVNYALPPQENLNLSLSPEEQIDKQLQERGLFVIWPLRPQSQSWISDKTISQSIFYDSRYYWDQLDHRALAALLPDGKRDIFETIYNRLSDASSSVEPVSINTQTATCQCNTSASVAQWLIDGKPLYDFRFTFDGRLAADDSDHRMNPSHLTGLAYRAPQPADIDQRKAFRFDGTSYLTGETTPVLDYSGRSFSAFATIKTDQSSSQTIFSLNGDNNFIYGIENSKLVLKYKDANGSQNVLTSNVSISDNQWHSVGFVYDAVRGRISLYVDGNLEQEVDQQFGNFNPGTYDIGSSQGVFGRTDYFKGYMDDLFLSSMALTPEQIKQYAANLHRTLFLPGAENVKCISTASTSR